MSSRTSIAALWVENTIQLLVDEPDQVKVEVLEGESVSVITVKVPKSDLGKVIGRQGIMADALRVFLNAFAGKMKTRYVLSIEG